MQLNEHARTTSSLGVPIILKVQLGDMGFMGIGRQEGMVVGIAKCLVGTSGAVFGVAYRLFLQLHLHRRHLMVPKACGSNPFSKRQLSSVHAPDVTLGILTD